MSPIDRLFLGSFVIGWVLVIVFGLIIAFVLQLLGEIHLKSRLGHHPLITDDGPELHERMPEFRGHNLGGGLITVSDFRGRPLVVLFLSLTCGPCEGLFRTLTRTRRALLRPPEFLLVVEAARPEADRILQPYATDVSAIIDPDAAIRTSLGITRVPYGLLVDEDGVTRMKGITNTRRHLEGLIAGRGHMPEAVSWQTPRSDLVSHRRFIPGTLGSAKDAS
jgi:methylamine dehydrogenase accessory protein MauD